MVARSDGSRRMRAPAAMPTRASASPLARTSPSWTGGCECSVDGLRAVWRAVPMWLAQVCEVARAAAALQARVLERTTRDRAAAGASVRRTAWRPSSVLRSAIAWWRGRCRGARRAGRAPRARRAPTGRCRRTRASSAPPRARVARRKRSRTRRGGRTARRAGRAPRGRPLRICLPAGDSLEPGRALQRDRLREAAVQHKRRLVDLQRDRDALGRAATDPADVRAPRRACPRSSCISTDVFPAPIAPSAPLTTSTWRSAMMRSKSTGASR